MSYRSLRIDMLCTTTYDVLMIPIAWYGAYWFRFNLEIIPSNEHAHVLATMWLVIIAQVCAYFLFRIYRCMWSFASLHDLIKIIKSIVIGGLFILLAMFLSHNLNFIPRSVLPIYGLILTTLLCGARVSKRLLADYFLQQQDQDKQRVLIVGAGNAGENLVRDMLRSGRQYFQPIAFVDDNSNKHGQEIHGIRIIGKTKDIPKICQQRNINQIVLAIPSLKSAEISEILQICEQTKLPISTLPSINNIVNGKVSVDLLRKISLEDLLGRNPVSLDWHSIKQVINNKVIMVTGAGGSIGSEVCRQIARLQPSALIAIDNSEFNLFTLQQEFASEFAAVTMHYHLINIQDRHAINHVLHTHRPELVFHAAAYKHVPMLENEIRAAVYNNIIGTFNLALAATEYNVKKFVMVSTDKAVNPQNIMGASKRIAEIICQSLNTQQHMRAINQNSAIDATVINATGTTEFITVRFGNVLGSAGSVIPIFRKQIENGGPVTVTHPQITRFFMTIPEASQLILQALALGNGGEIFVLDMGNPIKITLLAEQMIKLAGKTVNDDIKIIYTGLRPGEKLYEELFHSEETTVKTSHPKILQAASRQFSWERLLVVLRQLELACQDYDSAELVRLIKKLVPEHNFTANNIPITLQDANIGEYTN